MAAARRPGARMTVRPMTPADIPACIAIVRAWVAATPWMPDPPSEAELEAAFADALATREVWVAGDPVAGYLSLDPDAAHIRGLYAGRPGSGVGKALVDRAKEGRSVLTLNTHMPNAAAHRFYEREGFVAVDRDLPGDAGPPEMRMEWRA